MSALDDGDLSTLPVTDRIRIQLQEAPTSLVVVHSPDMQLVGRVFHLNAPLTHIGRATTNDIVLDSQDISRRHCTISVEDGKYFVNDLASRNGTWAGHIRVNSRTCITTESLQIGRTVLRFASNGTGTDFDQIIQQIVNTDSLTGLLNKNVLGERFESIRGDGIPCSLACWRVAHFGQLIQEFGEQLGDKFLRGLADRLRTALAAWAPDAQVGRVGLATFVALLPRRDGDSLAQLVIDVADQVAREKIVLDGDELLFQLAHVASPTPPPTFDLALDELKQMLEEKEWLSVFVSHGGPDAAFALRISEALTAIGVKTFVFQNDAVPGQPLHLMMHDGVNRFDRMLLLCSESALARPGVLNELEEVLRREAREGGGSRLIPLAVDDAIYQGGEDPRGIRSRIRDRVIADFRGAQRDDKLFTTCLDRLCRALRASSG